MGNKTSIHSFNGIGNSEKSIHVASWDDAVGALDSMDGTVRTLLTSHSENGVLQVSGGGNAFLVSYWDEQQFKGKTAFNGSDEELTSLVSAGQPVKVKLKHVFSKEYSAQILHHFVTKGLLSDEVSWTS